MAVLDDNEFGTLSSLRRKELFQLVEEIHNFMQDSETPSVDISASSSRYIKLVDICIGGESTIEVYEGRDYTDDSSLVLRYIRSEVEGIYYRRGRWEDKLYNLLDPVKRSGGNRTLF